MDKALTLDDIDEKSQGNIYTQDYSAKPTIEGVKIVPVKNFVGDKDGKWRY